MCSKYCKNIDVKVFNLISGVSKTRFIAQYELCECECKCRLNESLCNSKQKWNPEKGYMWNPSTCCCECNKACKIDKYLDTKNCLCEKSLIGKLLLKCEDEVLNTTETLLDDKKRNMRKKYLSYSHDFISNYMVVIISCCFYWLLLLLHKRLD